ncbi:hypothetical protein PYS58_14120 [Chryseobacterium indologenes]|uniref:hypothetical protein n=1 Tax=Chryseobacterium indologenes TaxID=253 RepID=UPI0023E8B3D6|nr:hypothetical protein [Chryseobacterium indologenes]WET47711.1 hypothetical protein PYS58_14120 [Chryseobacterium indologenes]
MKNDIVCDVQHTCKKSPPAYLIHNAPFKSPKTKFSNQQESIPFLGEGYYFWEENPDAAHSWGKRHYSNVYSIVEYSDLTLEGNSLLDLLDRKYSKYFRELISQFEKKNPRFKTFLLGQWIEMFKNLHLKDGKTFPYLYIRADEHFPDSRDNQSLRQMIRLSKKGYHTYLEPLIIICIIEKKDIVCKNRNVIY